MTPTNTALDPIAIWSIALVAVAGGFTLLWRIARALWRIIDSFDDFVEDWKGVPARPGFPARPGVMERLAWIEHELKPNSGLSLRDAVDRLEEELGTRPDREA